MGTSLPALVGYHCLALAGVLQGRVPKACGELVAVPDFDHKGFKVRS
jgi:hypothetical protein